MWLSPSCVTRSAPKSTSVVVPRSRARAQTLERSSFGGTDEVPNVMPSRRSPFFSRPAPVDTVGSPVPQVVSSDERGSTVNPEARTVASAASAAVSAGGVGGVVSSTNVPPSNTPPDPVAPPGWAQSVAPSERTSASSSSTADGAARLAPPNTVPVRKLAAPVSTSEAAASRLAFSPREILCMASSSAPTTPTT